MSRPSWVDQLRDRATLCQRAPSAHNTQPWVVQYGADRVDIGDGERALAASDRTGRDLFLSLGAFVETCLIVAADAGLAVRAEVAVDVSARRVARLRPAAEPYRTPFGAATVQRRRCARGRYHPGPLDAGVLARLRDLGADLRALPGRAVAPIVPAADRWLFDTPAVAGELREWLRLSPRHERYHRDGLTDRALALSRPQALALTAVLAPASYRLGRAVGVPALVAGAARGLVRPDGTVLALVGRVARPEDAIAHGRALQRVWLALTELDLAVHPLSQLLDCPATARRLGGLLGLAPEESAQAVFRVGRPYEEPARSARRPV